MLAPGAVLKMSEMNIPKRKLITDTAPDTKTTPLKLVHTRIAVSVGITIRLEMSSEPIIIIPSTTVTEVSTAKIMLYTAGLTPVALAKLSSNVTENILLYRKMNAAITMTDSTTLSITSLLFIARILPKR